MKHLKKFESFNEPVNEELFGLGKSADEKAYKRTSAFVEGDSEEAKKVKELYAQVERDKEGKVDPNSAKNKNLVVQITRLGATWAAKNKMEAADYSYKQVATVLEKDFSRKFKGGVNLNTGESVKYRK